MTPVQTLQRRFRELGRVKMGEQVETGKTYSSGSRKGQPIKRPSALRVWRFTSYGAQGKDLLEQARALYGGKDVQPWADAPREGGFELTTETDSLDFIVPPMDEPFTVWLEKWTAAGCERRCDGVHALVYGGRGTGWRERNCLCEDPTNPSKRECSISLRFGIILPRITGIGVWLVQSHSFHGAEELQGALAVLGTRAAQGLMTPATLRIEPREIRRPFVDESGQTKTEVSKFIVPVIDVPQTIGALVSGEGERIALPERSTVRGRPALTAGAPPPPTSADRPIDVVTGEVLEPEDTPELPRTAPEHRTGEAAARPTADDEPLGEDERRELFELAATLGVTDTELQRIIRDVTGQGTTRGVSRAQRVLIEGRLRNQGSA